VPTNIKPFGFLATLGGSKEFFEKHVDELFFPDSILALTAVAVAKIFRETEIKD